MSAEPVPPVTDNERDAQTIREALDHAVATCDVADDENMAELVAEARAANDALARLVAALSASTTERDEARAELAAAYGDTTSEWYTALDRERERAEALAAQLQQAREALSWALDSLELAFKRLDSVDEYSPEHYLIRQAGFDKARAALAAAAPATTLNEPEGEA